MLDEEFHRGVVDKDRAEDGEQIAQELFSALDMGGAEGDIAIEPKAGKECYREDDNQREDMWRDDHKAQIYKLFGDNEVIDDKVPNGIECHIGSTTSPVAENLLWNKLSHYGDVK